MELSQDGADQTTGKTRVSLTWTSPEESAFDTPELSSVERVCLPASVQIDDREDTDPAHTWETMVTLAGLRKK